MKNKYHFLALALLAGSLLAWAPAADAVDGVTLITQATATAGLPGCANDGSSLITICKAGSYRLSGNLIANGLNGIDITADGVALDLNGFTLSQSVSGAGTGIYTTNRGVSVANGTVSGFSTNVSLQGSGESVAGVRALDGAININVLTGLVSGSFALGGQNGIAIGEGVVENTTIQGGSGYGIDFGNGGLAKDNIFSNAGTCLVGAGPVRAVDNTFDSACTIALNLGADGNYQGNIFNGVHALGSGGTNGGQNVEHNVGGSGLPTAPGWDISQNKGGEL